MGNTHTANILLGWKVQPVASLGLYLDWTLFWDL